MSIEIAHRTGSKLKDLKLEREELLHEKARLQFAFKRDDPEVRKQTIEASLSRISLELAEAETVEREQADRKLKSLHMRYSEAEILKVYHDELGDWWIKDAKHPPVAWFLADMHFEDYTQHPEIRANDPEKRMKLRRKLQQADEEQKVERELAAKRELNTHIEFLNKSGATPAAIASYIKRIEHPEEAKSEAEQILRNLQNQTQGFAYSEK